MGRLIVKHVRAVESTAKTTVRGTIRERRPIGLRALAKQANEEAGVTANCDADPAGSSAEALSTSELAKANSKLK